jgi:hypothetical protein
MESATVNDYYAKPIQGMTRGGFVWTLSDVVKTGETNEWYRMVTTTTGTTNGILLDAEPDTYELDHFDLLPDSVQDALVSLEQDFVVPEFDRVIITNERYYQIDHNGSFGHTIVDTERYEFDEFSCGFDSETKTLCVRVYEYEHEDEQRYDDLPPVIECVVCGRGNSTFGLIGKEVVCDCGHRNRVM